MRMILLFVVSVVISYPSYSWALEKQKMPEHVQELSRSKFGKALEAKNVPVRVKSVQFGNVPYNGEPHLAVGIVFTKEIDAATVQPNTNIRLMKQENGFWVDLATQGNTVRIMAKHITWLSGAALTAGSYRMHLRGTIKDTDGLYLDCNNDGVGEGGHLPAYDSPIHTVAVDDTADDSGLLELIPQQ